MTTETTIEALRSATNLEALLALMRNPPAEWSLAYERTMTELPTFGGAEPPNTDGVWSWDEQRLLVGTCRDDMRIEDRAESEFGRGLYEVSLDGVRRGCLRARSAEHAIQIYASESQLDSERLTARLMIESSMRQVAHEQIEKSCPDCGGFPCAC